MNSGVGELPETGAKISLQHRFRQEDFDLFAELSGDDNPIHIDSEFAARTRFGRPVAHGMLLYGIICGLLSQQFPGSRQLEQNFMFPAPTYSGEELTIQAEVIEVLAEKRQFRLNTVITNPAGEVVCDGQTLIMWPE